MPAPGWPSIDNQHVIHRCHKVHFNSWADLQVMHKTDCKLAIFFNLHFNIEGVLCVSIDNYQSTKGGNIRIDGNEYVNSNPITQGGIEPYPRVLCSPGYSVGAHFPNK